MSSTCYSTVKEYSILYGLGKSMLLLLAQHADEYGWGRIRHASAYRGILMESFQRIVKEFPDLEETGLASDIDLSQVRRAIEWASEMHEVFWDIPKNTYKINVSPPDKPKLLHMPAPGYIYILESRYGYKIGKTKDLPTRMHFFGVKLPFETGLVHAILSSNITRAESALHSAYADRRIDGEWFALSDNDLSELCDMSSLELIA
jgi:hypothetical protein